ncbi:UBP-type zinc finger domain-containing protein [Kineococcus rhizosphaerae]|uniref:Ubiquitin-hydrolase Zn-finger-containing protein n=1 Tax=Kineococcus rhizosphaerae TaxID=559628 RepID=A0A2T0R5W3_9ACTN|nr:UBP-type zinc finger domain-containing protein [Kineococcus rhizosphaerae]PRY16115.1 ubiquitin-hydrolase Zn-finger-containing protein [Kineococcus rhizosphaerae]
MVDQIEPSAAPSGPGCADCDAAQPQGWWFHLRRCAACGHVGCCDSSPGQHARAHAASSGHGVVRSYEPGEEWFYDFASDETYAGGPDLAPPLHHPEDQPAPGPAGRVPANWTRLLH